MKILGIETTCDDTGIAILEADENGRFKVLADAVSSQINVHRKYGGVFPMMAKREHQKNLVPVLIKVLKSACMLKPQKQNANKDRINKILEKEPYLGKKLVPFLQKYARPDIDFIAVAHGPGLEPCLWVGVNFAKALSEIWNIPIVPINHIEGHILANFLNRPVDRSTGPTQFPAVCLIVSGGHTQLVLAKNIGDYHILGETRDDAAGECFDKCAKILGLSYPGGPVISKLAAEARPPLNGGHRVSASSASSARLPRPMINTKDYDFSFSGLKTAVLYHHQKQNEDTKKSKVYVADMAAEVQQAIIDVLLKKTIKAAEDFGAKTIILGGGVSANRELRAQLAEKMQKQLPGAELVAPNASLSTDNGIMIAVAGYFNRNKKILPQESGKIEAQGNLRI